MFLTVPYSVFTVQPIILITTMTCFDQSNTDSAKNSNFTILMFTKQTEIYRLADVY